METTLEKRKELPARSPYGNENAAEEIVRIIKKRTGFLDLLRDISDFLTFLFPYFFSLQYSFFLNLL